MYIMKLVSIYEFSRCQLSNHKVTNYNKEKQIKCTIIPILYLSFHSIELAKRGWVATNIWLSVRSSYDVVVVDSFGTAI